MTTQLKPTKLESKITSPRQSVAKKSKRVSTLRYRLLVSILPAVLIPLVIASTVGYILTERRAKNQILQQLENNSLMVNTTISTFIRNSFQTVDLMALNPNIIEAVKASNQNVRERRLARKPISQLEAEFAATKLLTPNNRLNNYLQQITKSGKIAEILITERNGLNIAYSNQTSDFVQRDEAWWQITQEQGFMMDEPDFDESANTNVIPFSEEIKDPQTGEFLGVIKAAIPTALLSADLASQFSQNKRQSSNLLVVDPDESFVVYSSGGLKMDTADKDEEDDRGEDTNLEHLNIVGNESIVEVIETIVRVEGNSLSLEAIEETEESESAFLSMEKARESIAQLPGFSHVSLSQKQIFSQTSTIASFRYRDRIYTLSTVPQTDFVSINVVDYELVARAARNLLKVSGVTAIALATISIGVIIILAQQITKPLTDLSATTQKVAQGDLDIEADLEGTLETRTLASNFNRLVKQVKESLQQQQTIAERQRQEKEQLERAIYSLIDEISDATEGDLTVRASLNSIELSTVADLFNAIIDSLQEIAIAAKQSTSQVDSSLKQNEQAIRDLAEQATTEAEETRNTLKAITKMYKSIQVVAANANQAEKIADDTYKTVLNSTNDMDYTVDSILNLRTTISETAKKMKRLGESSQKISQAVSFIEEIALKTNVLAINASVEAGRAGEYGEGFTIVAEQVGALAEQCAESTKEITKIVAAIQTETQEVNQAMESGTTQVVETTKLVETTKQGLNLVLEKSQQIHQLMGSISQTTISQADISEDVTKLMQKIAKLSADTSKSSTEVAQSIVETAQIAAKLESTVGRFKVAK
ncbi:MAG: methyl-accepting chemotaxis protein [Pleurocapsa sp. MO_226.B13]|nr:methyl-accepting chemotaxis protein [Pleurocapsa sp. MO_226.B13]